MVKWLIFASIMFLACIIEIIQGEIAFAVFSGICGMLDIAYGALEFFEKKHRNKIQPTDDNKIK